MATRNLGEPSPPYVSFAAFIDTVDWLAEVGLPQKFDQTVWKGRYSGPYGAQLIAGFRFLGLLSRDNRPTELFDRLVFNQAQRRSIVAQLIRSRYSGVADLDLAHATPKQHTDGIASYGMQGDTLRKAVTFFTHAASFAGVELSPYLLRKAKIRATGRAKGAERTSEQIEAPSGPNHPTLDALLAELARDGPTWTKEDRNRWLTAWTAVLDLAYPARGDVD